MEKIMDQEMFEKNEEQRFQNEQKKYIICRYDSSHVFPEDKYQEHLNTCPKKGTVKKSMQRVNRGNYNNRSKQSNNNNYHNQNNYKYGYNTKYSE